MSRVRAIVFRLRGVFERRRLEREFDEEMRFHLEMQTEDNLRLGMDPAEARYAALRSFGAVEPMKESYRERRGFALVETVAQDSRYALRILRKSVGFTTTAVAVLALGIGANTAMFSVLNAALLRPLPYSSPEQLAVLWSEIPSHGLREGRPAYWNVEQWRNESKSFADMAFFDGASGTLTSSDSAEKISIARISPNFFPLLGVRPLLGRIFSAEEAEQRERLVLVSYRFWQMRLAGSPEAIGASVELDGSPYRVIGVIPPSFPTFLGNEDLWEPYTTIPDWETVRRARGSGFWTVVGRLQPGVTFEQAQAEMSAIARRLDEQSPASERGRSIRVVPLRRQVTGQTTRLALWMLTGAVFCVLLIAASNIASLSLARAASRQREIAVRAALGASRGRIVRQLLVEHLTLAAISGVLGLLVAEGVIRLIRAVKPWKLPRVDEVSLDPHVLGWALTLCLLTAVLVGLAPAITLVRENLHHSSQEGSRSVTSGVAANVIRRSLVVVEFALALMLLAGAGLLIRSLGALEHVQPGYRPERVLSVQLSSPASMGTGRRANLYSQVLEQIESLPGVESAGAIENFLISASQEQALTTEAGAGTVSEHMRLRNDAISGKFFQTLGTPLLRGRFFSDQDGTDAPPVAIVNNAMARRLWPGRDPIGRRFKFGESENRWITVVGVAGDMRRQGLENEPIPQVFVPMAQDSSRLATVLIRTASDEPLKMATSIRTAVHRVGKYVPVYGEAALEDQLGALLTERRFQTSLLMGFSIIALALAAIGIYGLIRYSVAIRTQEIGIRMALGARANQVVQMLLGEGLKLSVTGLALGLTGALLLGHLGSSLLFGVSPADPLTLTVVCLLLTSVGMAACYFPARQAMRVDPMTALRQE